VVCAGLVHGVHPDGARDLAARGERGRQRFPGGAQRQGALPLAVATARLQLPLPARRRGQRLAAGAIQDPNRRTL
jgi:hypothetical protein